MTDIHDLYRSRLASAQDALSALPRRCNVLLGFFAAQPPSLVQALADRAGAGEFDELRVHYMHATPATATSLLRLDRMDVIKPHPFYMGEGERVLELQATKAGRKAVFFVPASFSAVPRIIRERPPCDAFLLQVAPMDRAGWFSFGLTGAYSLAGIQTARRIIVEVNPNLPRSHGTGIVHVSQVAAVVEHASELPLAAGKAPDDVDRKIADYVLPMVHDGACVQFGVGAVPEHHRRRIDRPEGSRRAHGAAERRHCQPDRMRCRDQPAQDHRSWQEHLQRRDGHRADLQSDQRQPCHRVPHGGLWERSPHHRSERQRSFGECDDRGGPDGPGECRVLAGHQYSAAGGQLDFVHGAYYSKGGLSFIVASSTAAHGKASRIVPKLQGPATDPRIETQYIVTEHGICDMRGKSSAERAMGLIAIADPAFRDELTAAARDMHLI